MIHAHFARGPLKSAIRNVLTNSKPRMDGRIPEELNSYIPREVRLTGAGRVVTALIPILVLAGIGVGMLMDHNGGKAKQTCEAIVSRGITIPATVMEVKARKEGNMERTVSFYYLVNGETHKSSQRLRKADKRPFSIGSGIPVRYLPENPANSWAVGYEPEGVPLLASVLVGCLIAFAPVGLVILLSNQRRMLAEGRPALARVVSLPKKNGGHDHHYSVECEFKALSGAVRRIKLNVSKMPPVGGLLTILYDKDNLKRASIYPLALVRVAKH